MEIYRILNRINNKSYIGATKWTFKERYPQSKWWKWTHSPHLKRAVERYGLENFDIQILNTSIKTEEDLFALEKLYINLYNSFVPKGYNLTKGGGSINPSFVKEYEFVDANSNIYKIKNLSYFCRKNKLNYSGMLNMVSGTSNSSQGYSLVHNIEYAKTSVSFVYLENIKTKEICKINHRGISDWGKSKGLNPRGIETVVLGKVKCSQGWKLKETVLPNGYRGISTKYNNQIFVSPEGKEVIIDNIYRFCKENGLDRKSFYLIINGKALEHKGWKMKRDLNDLENKKSSRLGKTFELISPKGDIVVIKNMSRFCREEDFNRSSIDAMLKGRTKIYKGWKLNEK